MKFCPLCAATITHHIPPGDDKLRYCCLQCDQVFYQNPNNIVGTVPIWRGQVLLCRRAIEPRKGLWTLPAGFMENGESTWQGALRETDEEAGAAVTLRSSNLYALYNLSAINQVYLFFRADLSSPHFDPGPESLEARLFSEHEIPWEEIAFAVVRKTLEDYFEDRVQRRYPVRMYDVSYSAERKPMMNLVSESPR